MIIRNFKSEDINDIITLWNESTKDEEFNYSKLTHESFNDIFLVKENFKDGAVIAECEGKIVGISLGNLDIELQSGANKGYITMLLVNKNYRKRGIGSKLLKYLEKYLIENNAEILEISFFNPTNLNWEIPNTEGHDHPNSPGVDIGSQAYEFFKSKGYVSSSIQNSYYLNLEEFSCLDDIENIEKNLKNNEIIIEYYDKNIHEDIEKFFIDLGNELWKKVILDNLNSEEPKPVLIVSQNNKVKGFTGPLSVQKSGRGYFAGIGVHSECRNLGVGKVLFYNLCKGLKEQGAEFMSLFTGETNPARKIYELVDFKIVKTWAIMRKEIK